MAITVWFSICVFLIEITVFLVHSALRLIAYFSCSLKLKESVGRLLFASINSIVPIFTEFYHVPDFYNELIPNLLRVCNCISELGWESIGRLCSLLEGTGSATVLHVPKKQVCIYR
jgi:hypothetical protein